MPDGGNEVLDYREPEWVAERLGLDKNTIYKYLQDGTIPAIQLGRKWLISEARLVEWMRQETDNQTRARREAAGSAERTVKRLDNLTAAARRAVKQAHTEARRYNHAQVGPEHLLFGLAADPRSRSARVMSELSIDLDAIRREVEARVPPGKSQVPRRLGHSAEARRTMRFASRLAARDGQRMGDTMVGTHHLLAGILLARQGVGYQILKQRNVTRQRMTDAIARVLAAAGGGNSSKGENDGH
jgi:excisionase family DNA binding protein